jgi:hypothetical protein
LLRSVLRCPSLLQLRILLLNEAKSLIEIAPVLHLSLLLFSDPLPLLCLRHRYFST